MAGTNGCKFDIIYNVVRNRTLYMDLKMATHAHNRDRHRGSEDFYVGAEATSVHLPPSCPPLCP